MKTYLRSTIGQGRLNALALLTIMERDQLNNLDATILLEEFASSTGRKIDVLKLRS